MIDTHAHIFLSDFEEDFEEMIERAKAAGIGGIVMPNIDVSTIEPLNKVAGLYSDFCFPMMGLHPCYVKENFKQELEKIKTELETGSYFAVGEIGTDLYWDKTYWEQQKEAFLTQMRWAFEMNLPVAIHCRESIKETIDLTRSLKDNIPRGVFHCFTGTIREAKEIVDMGFMLGIGGVATFKNGGLGEVLNEIPLENLVLETDSPYLAPTPFRGKRNEPSYIRMVAEKLATVKQVGLDEVIETTVASSRRLFGI